MAKSSSSKEIHERLAHELWVAVYHNDINKVNSLLKQGANINHPAFHGYLLLHRACYNGSLDVVKALVQAGADPGVVDSEGATPLHCACRGGKLEVVQYLVEELKCDVGVVDRWGAITLHHACLGGGLEVVQYLVKELNCDVGVMNSEGATLLHHACWGGALEVVQYLVEEVKCNVGVRDHLGRSPLDRALEDQYVDDGCVPTAHYLITKRSCGGGREKGELLCRACCRGKLDMVKELVEHHNIDPNGVTSNNGKTPLELATESAPYPAARKIVDYLKSVLTKHYIEKYPTSVSSKPGSVVELSIKTYSGSLKYQWCFQKKIISSQDADYSGSTKASLEIKRCLPKHKGEYYCVVTDESGITDTTKTATLSIKGQKMAKEECKLLGEILSKGQISLSVYGIEVKKLIEASCEVTYEEMQFVLGDNPTTRILSKNLQQELVARLEETNLYRKALENDGKVALSYTKILALGPGQVGKSTFLNRLLGVMEGNICTSSKDTQPQCSTGIAELREACISYSTRTGALDSENWQVFDRSSDVECQLEGLVSLLTEQALKEVHNSSQLPHALKNLIPRASSKTKPITSKHKDKLTLVDCAGSEKNVKVVMPKKPTSSSPPVTLAAGKGTVSKPQTSKSQNKTKTAVPSSQPSSRLSDASSNTYHQKSSPRSYPAPKLSNIDTVIMEFVKIQDKCQYSTNRTKFNKLLNIADIGGQPAFLEMLPSLTIGPALYLVFMKLLEGLTTRYPVVFKCKDGRGSKLCKNYTYTSEEVIFSALSSIACFGKSDEEVEQFVVSASGKKQVNSLALLVGTFRDKIKDQSQLDSIDHQIKCKLEETDFFNAGLIHSTTFLKVNNYCAPKTEILEQRKLLKNILEKKFQKYEIPTRWLTLSICLKLLSRVEQRYDVSFDDCVDLGSRIDMSRNMVRVALQFLHKYIGLVMYFPRNDNLKHVVICDPQVIFSSISELIFDIYDPNNMYISEAEHDHFVRTGCFSPQDIKDMDSESVPTKRAHLPINILVHLLLHLNIIAEVPANLGYHANGPTEDTIEPPKKYYFLPAVLQTAESSLLARDACEIDLPVPLCIRFQTGYIPLGFVCALTANLIAESDFKLIPFQQGNNQITYKNKIRFRYMGKFDIILISNHKYCEFRVTRVSGSVEFRDSTCCPRIKAIICEAADRVVQSLKHGSLYKPLKDQTYELAFRCPVHHTAEIGHEPIAKFVYRNATDSTIDGNIPKEIQCVDSSCLIRSALTPQMLMWFGEAISPPRVTEFITNDNVFKVEVKGTKPLEYKWFKDGEAISDSDSYQGSDTPELIVRTSPPVAKYKCNVRNWYGETFSKEILWGVSGLRTVTIEELKAQTRLTDSQLDSRIHVKDMHKLSAHFENVESYLTHLDLTPPQRTDIKDLAFRRGTQIAMCEALEIWRQHNPFRATYRNLVMILLELKKRQVAYDVCVYLSTKRNSKCANQ